MDPDEVDNEEATGASAGNAFNMVRLLEIAEQRNTTKKNLDRGSIQLNLHGLFNRVF